MFTVSLDRMKRLQRSFTSFKIVTQSVPSKENQRYEPKLWTIIHPDINVWQASITSQSINSLDSPFPLTTETRTREQHELPNSLKIFIGIDPTTNVRKQNQSASAARRGNHRVPLQHVTPRHNDIIIQQLHNNQICNVTCSESFYLPYSRL